MADTPRRAVAGETYSHEQELARWRREYLDVRQLITAELEEFAKASARPVLTQAVDERRREPRYQFMADSKIYAHMGPRAFPILNISIGGLAFHSDLHFEPGTKLLMSALGMIALDVEVLSCEMEETDTDLMECQYRVRARFGPHVNGYQVYVLAREMHLQNIRQQEPRPPQSMERKP